ncbi:PREDICTED: barttin [Merops nubicus]|uniref:barttin n=1 Tax=Merops nubicus TaxID=57421 RepID=UPI0004F0667F|nr:PREDICTED: barttin [Merops nubicus]
MAEEKSFRYGFIMLGFFLVMTGMFIMSVEKPQIYITFCALGVLLVAVGITWSMCQCYPKITFVPVDPEAEQFLDHKPVVLMERDTCLQAPCPSREATSAYEKSLPSFEQLPRGSAPGDAPLASLLEDMDTPSLVGSVPASPVPRGRSPPSATCSSCTLTSSTVGGQHPGSPHGGAREDDLYYGLQEGSGALLEDSEHLFEPEN